VGLVKPRVRPISNLYHRWGRRHGLTGDAVLKALIECRVIIRVDSDHYAELPQTPKMPVEAFEAWVNLILETVINGQP